VDGRPNRRNTAAVSIFSRVVWNGGGGVDLVEREGQYIHLNATSFMRFCAVCLILSR